MPALSIAFTVNPLKHVPTEHVVSTGDPLGTVPTHELRPDPPGSSAQLYSALTVSPASIVAPTIGEVIVMVGGVISELTV